MRGRNKEGGRERKRENIGLPSAGLLPNLTYQSELVQAEAISPELQPGPCVGGRGPSSWAILALLSQAHQEEAGLETEQPELDSALQYEMTSLQVVA